MDKVLSLKNKTFKKYWKIEINTGKSGNFVSPEKWEPCTTSASLCVKSLVVSGTQFNVS